MSLRDRYLKHIRPKRKKFLKHSVVEPDDDGKTVLDRFPVAYKTGNSPASSANTMMTSQVPAPGSRTCSQLQLQFQTWTGTTTVVSKQTAVAA